MSQVSYSDPDVQFVDAICGQPGSNSDDNIPERKGWFSRDPNTADFWEGTEAPNLGVPLAFGRLPMIGGKRSTLGLPNIHSLDASLNLRGEMRGWSPPVRGWGQTGDTTFESHQGVPWPENFNYHISYHAPHNGSLTSEIKGIDNNRPGVP